MGEVKIEIKSEKELKKLVEKSGFKVRKIGFLSRGRFRKANIYLVAEKVASRPCSSTDRT